MPLQGPLLVIAENPAAEVVDGLAAAGAFPVLQIDWQNAPTALAEIQPAAVILAEPDAIADPKIAEAFRRAIEKASPIVPVVA
jgi:hypothetical protein